MLEKLLSFLGIQPLFDYQNHLKYDDKKHFYCEISDQNKTKCLGSSKGRNYPPMDAKSQKFLRAYYLQYNDALVRLLRRINQALPSWLEEDMSIA